MKENYYYLFGSDAVRSYEEGLNLFLEIVKGGFTEFDIRSFRLGDNPTELLSTAAGWSEFTEIKKEEYEQLQNI